MRRFLVGAMMLLTAIAAACMWDYDTFAAEASGKNDVVAVLAGRFERNAPLYYQMRLDRCVERLKKEPENLDLYDNAAVALERLGRTEDAIKMIERKKPHLGSPPPWSNSILTQADLNHHEDHWYRYFANLGTFHAHLAMKSKGQKQEALLKQAEREIKEAIWINPNAHFGREKYQLYAIQWLLEDPGVSLWKHLEDKNPDPKGAVLGFSGLIRLGAAWESIDIWWGLASALEAQGDRSLAHFAIARIEELDKVGSKSFLPHTLDYNRKPLTYTQMAQQDLMWRPTDSVRKENVAIYADLRKQADEWHEARTAYMMERLKQGRHPDWDKEFWSDWKDEPKLDVPTVGFIERIPLQTRMVIFGVALLVALIVTMSLGVWLVVKRVKAASARRRAAVAMERERLTEPANDWRN